MALIDEITAKCTTVEIAAMKATNTFTAVAAKVSLGRVKLVETRIRSLDVLRALGGEAGQGVVDLIAAAVPTGRTTPAEKRSRPLATAIASLDSRAVQALDVSAPETRTQIDDLVAAGIMTAAQAATLKALAERPDPVTEWDISSATRSANGSWLI